MSASPKSIRQLSTRLVGGTLSQMATYADLFERLMDGIFLLDPETFQILETNPAVKSLLQAPEDSVSGQNFLSLIRADQRDLARMHFETAKNRSESETPFDVEMDHTQGRPLTLELLACRLKLSDYGEALQIIAKDVTSVRTATRELKLANEKLAAISVTDEMTGLFNFRFLTQELKKEQERAVRYGTPFSVILCDIDHFKTYNDQNGHQAGDEALRKVASLLKARCRSTDVVARYGGEEFLILCPGIEPKEAMRLAEALRSAVEKTHFEHGAKQPLGKLTISMGVAGYPLHGKESDLVVKAADDALYLSKGSGRNRVHIAKS